MTSTIYKAGIFLNYLVLFDKAQMFLSDFNFVTLYFIIQMLTGDNLITGHTLKPRAYHESLIIFPALSLKEQ